MEAITGGASLNTRQLSILKTLISQSGYYSAGKLARENAVSVKTIYKDIAVIADLFLSLGVEIKRKPRLGYQIIMNADQKNELHQILIRDSNDSSTVVSREQELFRKIFIDCESIDMIEYSLDNYISESSVKRSLEKIESYANDFNIVFSKPRGIVHISGSEADIRNFIHYYILTVIKIEDNALDKSTLSLVFDDSIIEDVLRHIYYLEEVYGLFVSEEYKYYTALNVLISLFRYRNAHIADSVDLLNGVQIEELELYLFAIDLLSRTYQTEFEQIPHSEIQYIISSLIAVGYRVEATLYTEEYAGVVERFIKEMGSLLDIDFSDDSHLKMMLINHIQPMIFRSRNQIIISNQTTEAIKTQYSVLYNFIWLSSKILEEHFSIALTDSEIAFLTIHFEIAIEKKAKPIRIYVVCPYHLAISELIVSQLRKFVSNFDTIRAIGLEELPQLVIAESDLVISTIDISDKGIPFILVNSVITKEQIESIQHHYYQYTNGNRQMLTQLNSDHNHVKPLVKYLLKNRIFLRHHLRSKEDSIEEIIHYASPSNTDFLPFANSIYEREKLGHTSTYTGIAMPHAHPGYVKRSEMILFTLDKPIRWGMHMVKVILFIAISEREFPIYKNALIQLYSKIDSVKYIESLWQSTNQEQFMENLFKEVYY
ncbi:BglG family transcription antiterminator [Streptococcus merionis]|uniref:BglG family transcription antiterminator n=1 Tax=Streptococcus merionis TaxID=400065 RepID=UPI0014615166|nr:PTS sugar transporter subunit IIA [Streptococcus merionis]